MCTSASACHLQYNILGRGSQWGGSRAVARDIVLSNTYHAVPPRTLTTFPRELTQKTDDLTAASSETIIDDPWRRSETNHTSQRGVQRRSRWPLRRPKESERSGRPRRSRMIQIKTSNVYTNWKKLFPRELKQWSRERNTNTSCEASRGKDRASV